MDPNDRLALLLLTMKRKLKNRKFQLRRCELKTASISPYQVKRHLPTHYEKGCYPVFNFLQELRSKTRSESRMKSIS